MDTAPTGTSTRPEFIPFAATHLCSHIPYDNLGFHSFPQRLGWKLSGAVLTHQDHSSVSAQLAFLQSWLFFGLIIEISCISGLPLSVAAEFLVDDGKQVSTAALNGLARRWVEADKSTQGPGVKARGAEVYACYKQLHFMLVNWSSRNGKDGRRLTEPECRVLLSIGMLRRVMILTAEYYSGVPTRMDGLDIFLGWDEALGVRFNVAGEMELRQMSLRQLLHLGWCPSEVGMLEISRQRHAHFFATILERKGAMQNHDHCGDQRCVLIGFPGIGEYNSGQLRVGQVLGRPGL